MENKKSCPKSYSGEHAYTPTGGDYMKCSLCSKTMKVVPKSL